MTLFGKSARVAGLRSCLPVALLGVLTAAQADPVGSSKYFVTFLPQNDMQILAVTEHDCNFTDVNFAVGTGVKNSYHCHVVSGVDALLGRGAPTGGMGPTGSVGTTEATHPPTQYQYQSGSHYYPSVTRSNPNPGYTAARGGMIIISFDTSSGIEVHQFLMNGNNLRALEPPAGGGLTFASTWRVLNSDVPTIEQLSPGPYTVAVNAPEGSAAKPLPNATSKLHLEVQGTDCTAQYGDLPKTVCAITLWNPQWISVVVSGTYLKQPDKLVRIDLHPVYNDPGHWFFTPAQFTPYSPLLAAVQKNDVAAVQAALAQGANPSDHPAELEAPLATAVQRTDLDIANLLVDHGADVNVSTRDGASVLATAIHNAAPPQYHARWLEFVRKLVVHHADVNRVAPGNLTPLMAAMTLSAQRDVVELLLASGANVNATTTLSQGLFGLGGRPITAYDLAQAELDAFNQIKAMQGLNPGEMDPVPPLQEVMAMLAKHGAKFLPNGGALTGEAPHFEAARPGPGLLLMAGPGTASRGETVTVTDVVTRKSSAAPVQADGSFRVPVAGDSKDLYRVVLSGSGMSGPPVYLHGDDPALALTLDSPTAGAGPGFDDITVTGSFTGPAGMGITVQYGQVRCYRGRFVAAGVRLKPGANTIAVTAVTLGGLTVTRTITVPSSHTAPVTLMASNPYGPKADPLEVDVGVGGVDPRSIKTLKVAWQGGAADDLVTSDPAQIRLAFGGQQPENSPFKHRYPAPGIYTVRMTVVSADGASTTLTQPVVAPGAGADEAGIQATWKDFTEALADGDADAALSFFTDEGREKYRDTLVALASKGKEIAASFSPLMASSVEGGNAEYVVVRKNLPAGGGNTFFVEFTHYPDGRWLLDSM